MIRPPCEVSWFSALCDDDYEFLGVPDPKLTSSWEHCRDIVMQAEAGGFDNVSMRVGMGECTGADPGSHQLINWT